jgi:hypothetical protein
VKIKQGATIMKSSTTIGLRPDPATEDSGKVQLGDMAPVFHSNEAKKVARDAATEDSGKVRLGDGAAPF